MPAHTHCGSQTILIDRVAHDGVGFRTCAHTAAFDEICNPGIRAQKELHSDGAIAPKHQALTGEFLVVIQVQLILASGRFSHIRHLHQLGVVSFVILLLFLGLL